MEVRAKPVIQMELQKAAMALILGLLGQRLLLLGQVVTTAAVAVAADRHKEVMLMEAPEEEVEVATVMYLMVHGLQFTQELQELQTPEAVEAEVIKRSTNIDPVAEVVDQAW